MKVQKSSNKKKVIIICLATVLLLMGGAFAYIKKNVDTVKHSDKPSEYRPGADTGTDDEDVDPVDSSHDETPQTGDGNEGATGGQTSGARIHIPNYRAENGMITVNISINEVWSEGECIVEVNGVVSRSARMDVFPAAQNSGCGPSISGLPDGDYTVRAWAEKPGVRTNVEAFSISLGQ